MPTFAAHLDSITLLETRFRDVNELGAAAGWDLGFRQLGNGSPQIPASLRLGHNISAVDVRLQRAYHQCGLPPTGSLSFGLPLKGFADWFGRPVTGPALLNFNCAGGLDGISRAGFNGFTLSVDLGYLDRVAADLGLCVPDHVVTPESGRLYGDGRDFRRLVHQLSSLLRDPQQYWTSETEDEICLNLLSVARETEGPADRSRLSNRARALRRAVAIIDDHAHEPPTVRSLCRETGVSWRTLDRAFKERFGIGPKAYLQRQRLMQVRAALLDPVAAPTVGQAANAGGFWHMGQFARDYRKLFGELPSDTLAQC